MRITTRMGLCQSKCYRSGRRGEYLSENCIEQLDGHRSYWLIKHGKKIAEERDDHDSHGLVSDSHSAAAVGICYGGRWDVGANGLAIGLLKLLLLII